MLGVDVDSPLMPIARRYFWTIPIVTVLSLVDGLLEGLGISLLSRFCLCSCRIRSRPVRRRFSSRR